MNRPIKIISGGQTGADQGGLVAGRQLGIDTGGWLPQGCLTEAGPCRELLSLYNMKEHSSPKMAARTVANARDSDGTVWFGKTGSFGFICTFKVCDRYEKPFRVILDTEDLREFVERFNIKILNVAGNRESRNKGIHQRTAETIIEAFKDQDHV